MASVVISGDTSGSVTLSAPTVAGSSTQTLVAATGTLAPLVHGTTIAAAGQTSIDFTGIPSWVKRVTVMFQGLSTNGTSPVRIRIGLTTLVTTGYVGGMITYNTNSLEGSGAVTDGFPVDIANASSSATTARHGLVTITNISGNSYVATSVIGFSPGGLVGANGGSSVTANGVIDRLSITTVIGTQTFDAGSINIMYE
jgi:hypothetical protein